MKQRIVMTMACLLGLAAMLGSTGCTYVQKGAAIGAGAGAIPGAIIGATTANAGKGAAIGAAGGAIIGALVGDAMRPEPPDETANLKSQIAALTAENERLRNAPAPPVAPPAEKTVEFVIEGDVLFASGSNVLTSKGRETLATLAAKIHADYPGKSLNVEGHTDNVPINASHWKSNWELGSGRALSVLHYMIDKQGFDAAALSATTFGEYKPVGPNDSPASRHQNRRAVIVVTLK